MKIIIISLALLSLQVMASNKGVDVIYGEDNRVDVFESRNSAFVELSKSTAAMIANSKIKSVLAGQFQISAETLMDRGICAKERFSGQITAANCSGFLVADDILVTAGHCIKTQADCNSYKWVFDYKVESTTQKDVMVDASDVFSCKTIISRSLDQSNMDDYAVIKLDRATNRRPLNFRRKGKISVGTELVVIGHPTGLPTKIADGAKVRSLKGKFFVANLDTYGGNSGSAVFNVRTGEVEGILVRGENDYVFDNANRCMVSNRCKDDACRGEDVTYITHVLQKIPGME